MAYRVEYSAAGGVGPSVITSRQDFGLDFLDLRRFFGGDLPPRFVDLLRVGEAIFVVDRLVRRKTGRSGSWDRELQVRIAVLDPHFWCSPEVASSLKQAVEFVSGDHWDIEFFGPPCRYEWAKSVLSPETLRESPLICLYSGGLDSAAGMALRMEQTPSCPIIPVTIKHQALQHKLVRRQYKLLGNRFGSRLSPLIIKARMNRPAGWTWNQREKSQRARSLLFAAVGGVAAAMTGQSDVEIFESGIGAINVPLMAGMVGSKATRGSHPEFLAGCPAWCLSFLNGRSRFDCLSWIRRKERWFGP